MMIACHKTQMIVEDDENTITEKKIRAEIHQLGVKWV